MGIRRTLLMYGFESEEYSEISGALRSRGYAVARCGTYDQLRKSVSGGGVDVLILKENDIRSRAVGSQAVDGESIKGGSTRGYSTKGYFTRGYSPVGEKSEKDEVTETLGELSMGRNRSEFRTVLLTSRTNLPERTLNYIDDIVKSPYTTDEIVWRVKKLFVTRDYLTIGDIAKLNKWNNEIFINGVRVGVTSFEADLLSYILDRKGIMNRHLLCRYLSVLTGKKINDRYLTTAISRLRKKIKINSGLDLIKSKRGLGYYCTIY